VHTYQVDGTTKTRTVLGDWGQTDSHLKVDQATAELSNTSLV